MPKFKMFAPGPYGAKQIEEFSYSQVMEVDGRIELSGQGGWHPETLDYPAGVPIETAVARAFDNVDIILKAVGLDWSHVSHVNSLSSANIQYDVGSSIFHNFATAL